jgi:hypothetical protein
MEKRKKAKSKMAYVVFDVDETLANLRTSLYFIASLKLRDQIIRDRPYLLPFFPTSLLEQQEEAYNMFLEAVLKEEQSDTPLGILRPGVLDVMEHLARLQQQQKVAAVILYSNNRSLPTIQFIRDLIHRHVGSDQLIKDCIHWGHEMRGEDKIHEWSSKTWKALRTILKTGPCQALVEPKQVYFFDDLMHMDLEDALKEQYYQVPAYECHAPLERIIAIYEGVIGKMDISTVTMMMIEVFELGGSLNLENITKNDLISLLISHRVQHTKFPEVDNGYRMMMEVVKEIEDRKRKRRYSHKARRYTVKKDRNYYREIE